jgi:outer membrane protein assembly factor BamB
LLLVSSIPLTHAGDWPQWRGPARDGHAAAGAPAALSLPGDPVALWRIPVGGGHSSPIVAEDKLVYLDEKDGQEVAHLLDAVTGREIWARSYGEAFEDEWGLGPRSTPLLDGDRLYVQSCRGEFRCLSLADGRVIWRTSFEKDFGAKFLGRQANEGTASRRGNNGSGVIDGDRIVVPVGGTQGASLVCFDKRTGQVLWKSGRDEAAYASFMTATFAGVKQVVALTADALLGADLRDGRILWRVPLRTAAKRHAASPVIVGDIVTVNSHTFGLLGYRVTREGEAWKAVEAWANRALKINLATPVLLDGHLYCLGPDRDYVCVEAATGRLRWSRPGFGQGRKDYASTIAVGEHLLVLTESGTLVLLAANTNKAVELARAQVCGNTWAHPAFANGRLYVRDGRSLACFNLAPAASPKP